jgi:hypothetical protein
VTPRRTRVRARALVIGLAALGLPLAARAGEAPPGPGRHDGYFPFRLGDSWTYDWITEGRRQPAGKTTRTRTFESTEFVGGGVAYKIVGDDGSYHVYTLRSGTLAIVSSSEAGRVLYYDPPIPLVTPDLEPGRSLSTFNADTRRTWKTTLLGPEDVTTPLGTFRACLKVRLEMQSPEHVSDSYHYFFPGVGLVAYRYELRDAGGRAVEARIEAALRLARLAGIPVADMADVARVDRTATVRLAGEDDPSARALLRRATEKRYTWDESFPGFRGSFLYVEEGGPPVRGSFEVDRGLDVRISAPTEAARAALRNQISSFVSHRKPNPFDLAFAGSSFRKVPAKENGDVRILTEGDSMGTSYTVRKDEIVEVGRSAGRLRFVARNLNQLRTEDGRYITVEYELVYYSNEDDSEVSVERTVDSYAKVGAYWLPTGRKTVRTERGRRTLAFELKLGDLKS